MWSCIIYNLNLMNLIYDNVTMRLLNRERVWLRYLVGNIYARTNFAREFQTTCPIHDVSITRKSRSSGVMRGSNYKEIAKHEVRRNGVARAWARATRRGYNLWTRHILRVRKCWQVLRTACEDMTLLEKKVERFLSTLNYKLEAHNVAVRVVLTRKWVIWSTIFLERIFALIICSIHISYILFYNLYVREGNPWNSKYQT